MRLFIHRDGDLITNVYVQDVPALFQHEDVLYTFQLAAESGDKVAADALPFLEKACMARPRPGVRVYLDND